MSDRAATEIKFNELLEFLNYYRQELIRLNNFSCSLQGLEHMAETCNNNVLIELEKNHFDEKVPIYDRVCCV